MLPFPVHYCYSIQHAIKASGSSFSQEGFLFLKLGVIPGGFRCWQTLDFISRRQIRSSCPHCFISHNDSTLSSSGSSVVPLVPKLCLPSINKVRDAISVLPYWWYLQMPPRRLEASLFLCFTTNALCFINKYCSYWRSRDSFPYSIKGCRWWFTMANIRDTDKQQHDGQSSTRKTYILALNQRK